MQEVRNKIQAHSRLRPMRSQRVDAERKPTKPSSPLPQLRLIKLQAPLPLGPHPRILQLTNISRAPTRLRTRDYFISGVFGSVWQPRVASTKPPQPSVTCSTVSPTKTSPATSTWSPTGLTAGSATKATSPPYKILDNYIRIKLIEVCFC